QSWLTGQFLAIGRAPGEQLEKRIVAEHVVVVLVGIASQDTEDPRADHLQVGMRGCRGVSGIVEGRSKLRRQANLLVQLPKRQQPCIAGKLRLLRLNQNGLRIGKTERRLPIRLYNHVWTLLELRSCFPS